MSTRPGIGAIPSSSKNPLDSDELSLLCQDLRQISLRNITPRALVEEITTDHHRSRSDVTGILIGVVKREEGIRVVVDYELIFVAPS